MNNRIQTIGQQRYYDFIEERAKKIRTAMIVWISLLCLAFISLFNSVVIAVILAVVGVLLAITNLRSQRELKGKLDCIADKEEFFHQLGAPDIVEADNKHVLITKDYVLVYKTELSVYCLSRMEKIEVGRQNDGRKFLFLTDKQGKRHEVMSAPKQSEEFDKVYYALKERQLGD